MIEEKYKNSLQNAAVAVPTLNRLEHLKRCIDSLAANSFAQYTDLYIGLDYPPNERYVEGWKEVSTYLDSGIKGFANVYIIKHNANMGLDKNVRGLFGIIRKNHNKFIFSEDDNEFSPNYLEYMNRMLTYYEDNKQVIAVAGYNYPMNIGNMKDGVYLSNLYFAAFGYGSWFDRYDQMNSDMNKQWLYSSYDNTIAMRRLRKCAPNQYGNFVKGILGYTTLLERDDNVWMMDLTYGLYMFFENKKMVYPIISKVRNWGFDGSGLNCEVVNYNENERITHRNFDFKCQQLDDSNVYDDIRVVSNDENEVCISEVNDYFSIPFKEVLRARLAYSVSKIIGIGLVRKIIEKNEKD